MPDDDDSSPEITESEYAHARRWRPGDPLPPVDKAASARERLRRMASILRAQADALEREADEMSDPR